MKNYLKSTSGLKEVGIGVISGILTELICQILFETEYSIIMENDKLILTPIPHCPAKAKVFWVLLTFFLIWLALFLLLHLILFIVKKTGRVKRPIYTKKSVIQTYHKVKTAFLSIEQSINNISIPPELYWDDLVQCVSKLYNVFCKNTSKMESTVKSAFNFTNQAFSPLIFPYEFTELISQMKQQINQICFTSPQFDNNKSELLKKIDLLSVLPDHLLQKK